jgi:hypothetical protein
MGATFDPLGKTVAISFIAFGTFTSASLLKLYHFPFLQIFQCIFATLAIARVVTGLALHETDTIHFKASYQKQYLEFLQLQISCSWSFNFNFLLV